MRPVAGGAPVRAEPAAPGLATSLLLALLLVLVPTGAALAASALPVPPDTSGSAATPGADDPVSRIPVPSPVPGGTGDAAAGAGAGDAAAGSGAWATSCPSGLFGWVSSPSAADDCLADTLGSSVSWMFEYSVTTVTTYVAFNPLRGSYWQVYLWHFGLLVVVALLVAVVQWMVSLVVDGAAEGMRSAGRSFVLLAVGLPGAFSVPFLLLLVDAGVLAVTGAFAGVFASRVTELAGQVSSAVALGDSPGALLAAVLLTAFLFPLLLVVLFAFVLRQIAVYAIPVFGQFGLLQAIAGDDGAALRTYFRIMAGTLLFPLQFVDLLVIGVSFLDFSTADESFVSLLYIIGVVLFALLGGSFLSLVFGTYAGHAAYAGARRAGQRRRQGRRLWRPSRSADRPPSRLEQSRLASAAGARWDARRAERETRRDERAAARTPANPLYWLGRAPEHRTPGPGGPGGPDGSAGAGGQAGPRTYGDRARERRGRRVGGSSGSGVGGGPGPAGRPPRGRSPRGPRPQ